MMTLRRRRSRPVPWTPDVHVSRPEGRLPHGWEAAALATLVFILMAFGLVTLHSASSVMASQGNLPHYHYVSRQAIGGLLGLVVMVAMACVPTSLWNRYAKPLLVISIVLLVMVVTPGIGTDPVNGARRWLDFGVRFQPSDPAKLAIAIWTASAAARKQDQLHTLSRGFPPFLVIWAIVVGLLVLEPDISTAVLIVALGASILFAAGARLSHFGLLGFAAIPVAVVLFTSGYRRNRWGTLLLNPGSVPEGGAYQSYQSLLAIGSGGVTGAGFGQGQQKFGFLPEAHNDFIFAMIGEEWGLVGTLAVLGCFVAIVAIGFRISRQAANLFGQLLAVGLASLIGLQVFLHIGVGLGMVPATGLSLPLISYGRSNLITILAAAGILMAVAREGSAKESQVRVPAGVPQT